MTLKIGEATVLDISPATRRPLASMVSQVALPYNEDPRSGRGPLGTVHNAWDWAIESCNPFVNYKTQDVLGYVTTYVLPVDDQLFLVGHSVDSMLRPLLELARAYRRSADGVLARRTPTAWAELQEGVGFSSRHGIIKVRTDRDYWFCGAILHSSSPTSVDVDSGLVDDVMRRALIIMNEAWEVVRDPKELILDIDDPWIERLETAKMVVEGISKALDFAKNANLF